MTVPTQTAPEPGAALVDAVVAAAGAVAAALPVADEVTAVPGAAVELPPGDAVAVTARLVGSLSGTLTLLAGADIVAALTNGPLGALDPAAALQPALDAAAATLGGQAEPARQLPLGDATARLGRGLAVPLLAGTNHHATLVAEVAGSGRSATPRSKQAGLDLLRDVEMEVTVEIGRTRMTVRELLALTPGTVVELDRAAGSPADLLVNGTLLARGEIVVVDEDFGIRVTEIVSSSLDVDGASR